MNKYIAFLSSQKDLSLLVMRICTGGIIFWAGCLKVFVFGFSGTTAFFAKSGIFWPEVTAPFILLLEFFGGGAILLGLFTRYLGLIFAIEHVVAFFIFSMGLGYLGFRINFALFAFGILMAAHGAGKYSLDRMLKLEK